MAALARSPFRSPLYWVTFAAGLGWTVLLWTRAAPLASALDDEIGHFLIARDAWVHPQLMLNAWGRVGTTMSFLLPAAAGLEVERGLALAMSATTVVVATQVARLIGVRALALVPVFLWFQPWFHVYGNAVLTEVPFSLVMVAGCWAALAGRTALASLLFGMLPLMRHEGIAVLGLWAVFLLVRRAPWPVAALGALPLLAYQTAFSLVFHKAPFALYFRTTPGAPYGHGGWLHYFLPLARSLGPPVALLAAGGVMIARRDRRFLALAAPYALLVVVETVIFRFGLFGSGGNVAYLLPVAAFAAVAAALAADRVMAAAPQRALRAPAIAAAVLALSTAAYALRTRPARADPVARPMSSAVHFLEARHADMRLVTATHVWFFELSGAPIPVGDGLHSPWSRPPPPRHLALGAIVVWDCSYSDRFGLRWGRLRRAGFVELARFGGGRVVVFRRRTAHGTTGARRGVTINRPRCL
jgi:hypothetical protein